MMNKFKFLLAAFCLILAAVTTTGCVTRQTLGNFANTKNVDMYKHSLTMAEDVSNNLPKLFAPAQTKLKLDQVYDQYDYFAIHLIKSLRAKGYAITESQNAIVEDNYFPMTYIINNRKDNLKSYELILFIGKYRLARFYEIKKDGSLKHNSNWSVKQ